MKIFITIIFAFSLIGFSANRVLADDLAPPNFAADTLTGDWGGARTSLYNKGVNLEGQYTLDLWRNVAGGYKTGNAVNDDLDLQMTLDGGKLYGLDGSTVYLYLLNNEGGHINNHVGSVGGIDNIEVAHPAARLYEAWIQQNWLSDRVSALIGLYDLNSEFYVTDTSGLFLNPTYGIGTEFGATGNNGPSIFPATAPGLRLRVSPTANIYAQAVILDGVPGDRAGLDMRLRSQDGALIAVEAGYRNDAVGHYAVGAWDYTSPFADWMVTNAAGDPVKHHNNGVYALAERTLYTAADNPDRKVDGFVRLGVANDNVSQVSLSWSAGLVYSGVWPKRKDSQLGFAISGTQDSRSFRDSSALAGQKLPAQETQFELTYSDKPAAWLTVQPDLQYTIHPAADSHLANALTVGVRLRFKL